MTRRADEKVFQVGEFLFGFTTSFRIGQLLRYSFAKPLRDPESADDFAFMVTQFVPAVKTCLKDGGFNRKENEVDTGGRFLVGYRGHLYRIDSDYQVGSSSDEIFACGAGEEIAMGALFVSKHASSGPEQRIKWALEAAAYYSPAVGNGITIRSI